MNSKISAIFAKVAVDMGDGTSTIKRGELKGTLEVLEGVIQSQLDETLENLNSETSGKFIQAREPLTQSKWNKQIEKERERLKDSQFFETFLIAWRLDN